MTPADILSIMNVERRMPQTMDNGQRMTALVPVVALYNAGVPKDASKEFHIIIDALVDRAWAKYGQGDQQ